MTRRESFMAAFSAPTKTWPERKNKRKHHSFDRLYHGPIKLDAEITTIALSGSPYKDTHQHLVLKADVGGIKYRFRCLPAGETYLGEIVRQPDGVIRVHVWTVINCPTAATVTSVLRRWKPDKTIPVLADATAAPVEREAPR